MKHFSNQQKHLLFKILIVCLTLISSRGFSHDFWLEAHPFYTKAKKPVDISVHVGNEFIGDSLPNILNWYTDFSLYQKNSKTDIKGELGRDPAGYFTPDQTGTYAIGYQSDFSYVEIDPETFIKYLTDEGLDNAIQFRQKNKLTQTIGKENYIRHAKALVQSGDQFGINNSKINMGYELEIIPLSNPYKKNLNDTLKVKILYQNKPVSNILLTAYSKIRPRQTQSIRSNNKGEASITLDQTGPWLLKAVKIQKINDGKANWQSHWASLTFEVINP
ncbi:MAG: DUF4198 domain-containing protein [Gammaproteobacteria bacterium]|nr:DUF4198 domain-containing protein [Gammaproteobacteria bacterium]